MLFWIIAALIALIITLFLGTALLRAGAAHSSAAAYDLQVYRDQLKDVDKDLARGVIAPEDADRTRTEISRRILATDAKLQQSKTDGAQPKAATKAMVALVGLTLVGGSLLGYQRFGTPGYEDQPLKERYAAAQNSLETRPSQSQQEAALPPSDLPQPEPEFQALMQELRNKVANRPTDLQGHVLLARNEATLGNFQAAYQAQQTVIALKGDQAQAADHIQLASLMINAAQGYVSPEAETALRAALNQDPANGLARFHLGRIPLQNGRPDMTFRIWRDLLEEGPESAPWIAPIRANIDDLAWLAGVNYTAPAPRGPSADDIAAAQDLSAEDQANMIQGMVTNLSDRLATEGGTPAEWAQLIMAYGVLNAPEQAQAILSEARTVFAGNSTAQEILNTAAQRAGLDQ